jgi:hypothetical protein
VTTIIDFWVTPWVPVCSGPKNRVSNSRVFMGHLRASSASNTAQSMMALSCRQWQVCPSA